MAIPYTPIARSASPPRVAVCFTHHRDELSPEGTKAVTKFAAAEEERKKQRDASK